jgi:hypothetical protein
VAGIADGTAGRGRRVAGRMGRAAGVAGDRTGHIAGDLAGGTRHGPDRRPDIAADQVPDRSNAVAHRAAHRMADGATPIAERCGCRPERIAGDRWAGAITHRMGRPLRAAESSAGDLVNGSTYAVGCGAGRRAERLADSVDRMTGGSAERTCCDASETVDLAGSMGLIYHDDLLFFKMSRGSPSKHSCRRFGQITCQDNKKLFPA